MDLLLGWFAVNLGGHNLNLVVMSATINASGFVQYFQKFFPDSVGQLHIAGKSFEVEVNNECSKNFFGEFPSPISFWQLDPILDSLPTRWSTFMLRTL